jgi:hypothetical protein
MHPDDHLGAEATVLAVAVCGRRRTLYSVLTSWSLKKAELESGDFASTMKTMLNETAHATASTFALMGA